MRMYPCAFEFSPVCMKANTFLTISCSTSSSNNSTLACIFGVADFPGRFYGLLAFMSFWELLMQQVNPSFEAPL